MGTPATHQLASLDLTLVHVPMGVTGFLRDIKSNQITQPRKFPKAKRLVVSPMIVSNAQFLRSVQLADDKLMGFLLRE